MAAPSEAFVFWQHDQPQAIPNDAWTALAWNLNRVSRPTRRGWTNRDIHGGYTAVATTIAVASNGQALPQATINVGDTSLFPSAGWLAILNAGADRIVKYTGKTATTFTGCTGGVGTLATNDPVRSANVEFKSPFPALTIATAEVHWASNATGLRGIRFNFNNAGIVGGTTVVGAVAAANPLLHIQTTEQPAWGAGGVTNYVEAYQSSTATLNIATGANLDAPRLVMSTLSTYTTEPLSVQL